MQALLGPESMTPTRPRSSWTQTGGGCRASNYIGFIRRALKKVGMEYVPVISLNLSGLERQPRL